MKKSKILRWIVSGVLAAVMVYSGIQVGKILWETHQGNAQKQQLIEQVVQMATVPPTEPAPGISSQPGDTAPTQPRDWEYAPISVDFEALQERNPDVVAWLYCPDTPIHYPVVQSADNDAYLHRLLDGTWNAAGTLFVDYRNRSDFRDLHTVIYGHHMKNGSMFAILPDYEKQGFFEAHPVWYLLTPTQNYRVDLFAGVVTPADSSLYDMESTEASQIALIDDLKKNSCFPSSVEVTAQDCLVSFSTCVYEYENARFVLTGVLREIG